MFYDDNYPRHFYSRGWMEGVSVMMTGDFVLSSRAPTLSRVDLGLKANSAPFNWPSSCQSNCQNIPLICAPLVASRAISSAFWGLLPCPRPHPSLPVRAHGVGGCEIAISLSLVVFGSSKMIAPNVTKAQFCRATSLASESVARLTIKDDGPSRAIHGLAAYC